MHNVLLVINTGSSSMKFALFSCQKEPHLLYSAEMEDLYKSPSFTVFDHEHTQIIKQKNIHQGLESGLRTFFTWFNQLSGSMVLMAVGHRVVHGGMHFFCPVLITEEVMNAMAGLNSLAPLHQPQNLEAIKIISMLYPALPQIACFDTTFHLTQKRLASLFAIPRKLTEEGIIRYGFHGISYEYIAAVITQHIGEVGNQRVIVAHLGNGASMCGMYKRQSVATSMGLTALDGLMMGTRCGQIDPGVLLYLIQEKNYSAKEVEYLLYNESGLLGVSGISHDVRKLLAHADAHAKEAIELFCYRAALEIGSLSVALNGCDALVFTAGIGENSPIIRKKICEQLAWLGIKINDKANEMNAVIISDNDKFIVSVIPTNEEYMIAKHTNDILAVCDKQKDQGNLL